MLTFDTNNHKYDFKWHTNVQLAGDGDLELGNSP